MSSILLVRNFFKKSYGKLAVAKEFSVCARNQKIFKALRASNEEKIKIAKEQRNFLTDYEPIYQFRFIRTLKFLNRVKIYQTFASVGLAMSSLVMYEMQKVSFEGLLAMNTAMVFAMLMLLIISRQTVRVVGRMYLRKDGSKVIISHLNFWGKRRDFEVELEKIEPVGSVHDLNETILNLRIKDMEGSMLLSLPYSARGLNKEGIFKIFKVDK